MIQQRIPILVERLELTEKSGKLGELRQFDGALMLDGLFSAVNFVAAIFAARVAKSVRQAPDELRPFGYEIDESVFVMFRGLVLLGCG